MSPMRPVGGRGAKTVGSDALKRWEARNRGVGLPLRPLLPCPPPANLTSHSSPFQPARKKGSSRNSGERATVQGAGYQMCSPPTHEGLLRAESTDRSSCILASLPHLRPRPTWVRKVASRSFPAGYVSSREERCPDASPRISEMREERRLASAARSRHNTGAQVGWL